MAWIESHQELAQHPKTKRLARALGVSVPTAIGHLHLFWWWALSYALDGDISDMDDEDVADAAMWEGDASAFVAALRRAGFVDDEGQIHDWEEYSGKWQERRNANAARVRAHRERARNAHVSVTQPLGKGATGPNLTGPNLTGQLQQAVVVVNARNDDGGADAPTVTATAATAAQGAKAGYLALSEPARAVVDDWRSKQGKKRPPKLNPAQVEEIELAVAELGAERLSEANTWAARNGVPEIVKAIRAARTKRQRDEDEALHSEKPSTHPEPDGADDVESLAPPTDADAALWDGARSDLAEQMSRPNWETYLAPLTVAGRGVDGGLRLRAPPGLTTALKRFRSVIVRSLDDAGDPGATRVAIVEARPGQE